MHRHHTFKNVNDALPWLAECLLQSGARVTSRVGPTQELTFQHITLTEPLAREITVQGRKANIAAQIAETMWVLAGRNDVEWLSAYLPRAAEFSDDGKTWRAGYGPRLRNWTQGWETDGKGTDQLARVIDLLREDSGTRRAVVSLWDPAVDTQPSKDIPCNNWLHFLARDGVLDLHVTIRSNDLIWGWSGINQFEWSTLLEVVAAYSGLAVGHTHYSISSLHIYERHWKMARNLEPHASLELRDRHFEPGDLDWNTLVKRWFQLEQQIRHVGSSRSNIAKPIAMFPEPMLRSWLWVLAWWWTGDEGYLTSLGETRLYAATQVGTGPRKAPQQAPVDSRRFIEEVSRLHLEKHAAYGDSWKRRGEMLGILANIARKIDRLGGKDTTDENRTDTAVDLMVYLAKYRTWLGDLWATQPEFANFSDDPRYANELLEDVAREMDPQPQPWTTVELEDGLREGFDKLEKLVLSNDRDRENLVDAMLRQAYVLAARRWHETPALFARPVGADEYRGADHE